MTSRRGKWGVSRALLLLVLPTAVRGLCVSRPIRRGVSSAPMRKRRAFWSEARVRALCSKVWWTLTGRQVQDVCSDDDPQHTARRAAHSEDDQHSTPYSEASGLLRTDFTRVVAGVWTSSFVRRRWGGANSPGCCRGVVRLFSLVPPLLAALPRPRWPTPPALEWKFEHGARRSPI